MALVEPQQIQWVIDKVNRTIQKAYVRSSQLIANPPLTQAIEEPTAKQGVDGLKLFMDAKALWEEIKPALESAEFFMIVINAMPGSGKTDIARQFACLGHQEGFVSLYYPAFKALDMPVTVVAQAQGSKRVLIILDDMSYALASIGNKQASKFKNWITQIRHALKTEQVFLIVIGHFTTAVPPVMKNSNIWIFPAPTTQEQDAMIKVVGRSQKNRRLFEIIFNAVRQIQSIAKPHTTLEIQIQGRPRDFTWDDDGRLGLLIKNGESLIFHSKQNYCEKCALIGKNNHVDSAFYAHKSDKDEGAGIQ